MGREEEKERESRERGIEMLYVCEIDRERERLIGVYVCVCKRMKPLVSYLDWHWPECSGALITDAPSLLLALTSLWLQCPRTYTNTNTHTPLGCV